MRRSNSVGVFVRAFELQFSIILEIMTGLYREDLFVSRQYPSVLLVINRTRGEGVHLYPKQALIFSVFFEETKVLNYF